MTVSPQTVSFVAAREGFTPTAYWDGDHYSIGYGTYATPDEVRSGAPISQTAATQRLNDELAKSDAYLDSVIKVPLSPQQRTSLTSMAYNVGSFGPDLVGAVNNGNWAAVPLHMAKYGAIDPKDATGVANRRNAEIALWNGHTGGTATGTMPPSSPAKPLPNALLAVAQAGGPVGSNALAGMLAPPPQYSVTPTTPLSAQQPTSASGGTAVPNLLATQVRPTPLLQFPRQG